LKARTGNEARVNTVLQLNQIDKRFDGVHALDEVSLEIAEGEVHALMGENGAGKSTLAKIVAGVIQADSGEIIFRGRKVDIRSPLDAQKLGIGIVFQELDLFPHLSVAENIVIGNFRVEERFLVNFRAMEEFCRPFLSQVGLNVSPTAVLSDLPIGHMQLVAIARALSMDAKLILMDEPTSAIGDEEAERLFGLIRQLTSRGVSVLYVSHKMQEIFKISDRLTVLRDGKYIGTRWARETSAKEIIAMMVGRGLAETGRSASHRGEARLLRVRDLFTRWLRGISFDLSAGEVLGVAGLVGSGRSELGAALFGLDRIVSGTIELRNAEFRPRSPRSAIRGGVGLLPEDRKL
jgi:ABC-type sugar transport system ATPase subunit